MRIMTLLCSTFICLNLYASTESRCLKNLESVYKIKEHDFPQRMCKSPAVQQAVNKKINSYNECLKTVEKFPLLSKSPYYNCASSNFRKRVSDTQYLTCINSLMEDQLKNNITTICSTRYNQKLVASQDFSICMDKTIPLSGGKSFELCRNLKTRDHILTKTFDQCRKEYNSLFDQQEVVLICAKDDAEKIKKYNQCHDEMNELELDASFCQEQEILNFDDKKSCFQDINTVINVKEANKYDVEHLLKQKIQDCKNPTQIFENDQLRFINAQYFFTSTYLERYKLGGLSALSMNPIDNNIYFVSDDQMIQGPSRIVKANIEFINDHFHIRPLNNILLKKHAKLDAEGMQITEDGSFIISSETLNKHSRTLLRMFDIEGNLIEDINTPKAYKLSFTRRKQTVPYTQFIQIPYEVDTGVLDESNKPIFETRYRTQRQEGTREEYKYTQTQGILVNKGLEALSLSLDKKKLYFANEEPLKQDGHKYIRITIYNKNKNYFTDSNIFYKYKLENGEDNGLAELLEVRENEFFALERRYDRDLKKVIARVYSFKITKNTKNESVLAKELILDFDEIISSLPTGLRKIDNIEGMGIGPQLPNGNRSLIFVSDNNFNPQQKTQILFFELLDR